MNQPQNTYPMQQQYQYPPQQQNPPQFNQQQNYPNQYPPQQQAPQQYPSYQQPPPTYQQQPAHQVYDIYPENPNQILLDSSQSKNIDSADFGERKGFIVKVYTLLSLQLGMTFALTLAAYLNQNFRNFLVDPKTGSYSVFSWICIVVLFITEIAIFCCKKVARQVPNNYIAMTLFTFCMSVMVSGICGIVYNALEENGAYIVLAAALLTMAVTLSLTLYACTTKTDFTMMGGALWIISAVLMVVFIISWFNPSVILQLIICGLVIICYGFYLIYDTQLIVGGKSHELSIDDYVIGAMLIYIDIIVLFLRILQLLLILFGKK